MFGEAEFEFEEPFPFPLLFNLFIFFSFIEWFADADSSDAFSSGEGEEFDCLDFIFLNISASEYGLVGFISEVILSSGLCIPPDKRTPPRCYYYYYCC